MIHTLLYMRPVYTYALYTVCIKLPVLSAMDVLRFCMILPGLGIWQGFKTVQAFIILVITWDKVN